MTQVEVLDTARDRAGGYKVDVSRGEQIDAALREEIYELTDDFGRALKGWIGQSTPNLF